MPKVIGGRARVVQNKGYSHGGASHTKKALKGFYVESGSPAEDINANNYTLRQRSRILYQTAPIATAALKRQRTNIIGSGLRLKSTIDRTVLGMSKEQAADWQRLVQREFALWASDKRACDATGVNNFYGMQQLIALAWPMSGDVFALVKRAQVCPLLPYSLRLHLIEADRVRTPDAIGGGVVHSNPFSTNLTTAKLSNGHTIFDGVEVDGNGAIVAYHIANTYPYQYDGELTQFTRVEAYGAATGLPNVLHIMDTERPEQYRGVPYLAQAIEPLLQMRRYTEAELMAAIVESFFTAFVKTNAGAGDIPFNEVGDSVSDDPNEYELGPGTVNFMEPGEDVVFANPTRPSTGFSVFMHALCEQMGAALEIPVDLLMMSFDASYSASRAALLEAWKGFRMRREWLTDDFCRPVYELWLTEAVARGRIPAPGFLTDPTIRQAYLASEWIGPSQGQLDPIKEVEAAVIAIAHGLSTHEAEGIRINGSEYAANVDKLAVENELLRKANGSQMQTMQQSQTETQDKDEKEEENHAQTQSEGDNEVV